MDAIQIRGDDAGAVGEALARAFMDDPVSGYVLPDPDRRWALLSWLFPRWVRVMARRGKAYTTPDFAGGALWRPPEAGLWVWVWEQVRAGLLVAPFKLRPGEMRRFFAVHAEGMRRMRRSVREPHWVLDVLGVAPGRQGQGVARCLLTPVLGRADTARLPCYLITNKPTNVPIYGRFGFEVIREGTFSGTEVMIFEMRRPAP